VHAIQNKNLGFPHILLMFYTYFMPCVSLFAFVRRSVSFVFESFTDCLPERLTHTLTVLEIVYYCIACVYFLTELICLLVSSFTN